MRISQTLPPPRSLLILFPYLPLYHLTPPFPFPKEVNKKLSYRGQNALSVIKTHERNTDSERILYLSVRQSRLTGRIMFSTQGLKKRAWRHGRAWKMKIRALKNHDPCFEFASKRTQLYRHKV